MTYENVTKWLIDNVPFGQYDSYKEWYEQAKEEIHTPNLFKSFTFNQMLEREVKKAKPRWFERPPTKSTKKQQTYESTKSEFKTFRITDIYEKNPNRPKSSIRRELQELTKEGKLVRVRRGVYQTV